MNCVYLGLRLSHRKVYKVSPFLCVMQTMNPLPQLYVDVQGCVPPQLGIDAK